MTSELPLPPREFLLRHAPFDRLPTAALDRLEATLEIQYAAPGEILVRRGGAPAEALWVVRKGQVRLERDGVVDEVLGPGEAFGYPSLLRRGAPLRDAVAAEDCLLFRFPPESFRQLLDEPGAARFFLDGLAERLAGWAPERLSSEPPERSIEVAGPLVRSLRELSPRRPLTIAPAASVGEAARRMAEARVGSLLVAGGERPPDAPLPLAAVSGIVTDRDLRNRVLARGRGPETPVGEIASFPLRTLSDHATVLDALVELSAHEVRHLPLVHGDLVVGVISAGDLARLRARDPVALVRRIEREDLEELLPRYADEVRRSITELARSGLEAVQLGPLAATLHEALARRLLAAACAELDIDPGAVAFCVHGSDGRREQLWPTDQDNALVVASATEPPPERVERLAERLVADLERAGFPLCPGGFMATRWRDPLALWQERFEAFIEAPRPEDQVDLATLLDLRRVAGGLDLAPLAELRRRAGASRHLLRRLAEDCARWSLPIGLFGGLREGEGGFDLKRGSLAIVAVARLSALEAGSAAESTLDRLRDAEPVLGGDAATLAESFRVLVALRLEHALLRPRPAGHGSHRVELDELNALERRFLKDIFGFLRSFLAALGERYAV
jgi:CBS domain-containing protein